MPFHCIVGGRSRERVDAARTLLSSSDYDLIDHQAVAAWPFARVTVPGVAAPPPIAILIEDLHAAFLSGQTPGTRLVLTQSTYQLQRWLDWLAVRPDVSVVALGSRARLSQVAAEWVERRGPWHAIEVTELSGDEDVPASGHPRFEAVRRAFTVSPDERRAILEDACRGTHHANAAIHLALASTCMELDDLQPAQDALERAGEIAPDWEAVWFEYGKLWIRADDLERAAERFAEAARLMPTFSAALSNLGAALAETDRPDEAMAALEQALRSDPRGYPILNNLAVIYREQGRLEDAIEAGRKVTALAPSFVFGSYNLAHALFLSGRFEEARDVYEDAHHRDPQKNPIQAARLAVVRAACGEAGRAAADMRELLERIPGEVRERIVEEADATLDALAALPQPAGNFYPLRAVITESRK
jgi:tetratricopeptide (TPR) repeat protein